MTVVVPVHCWGNVYWVYFLEMCICILGKRVFVYLGNVFLYILETCFCIFGKRVFVYLGNVFLYIWETCICVFVKRVFVYLGNVYLYNSVARSTLYNIFAITVD
jgi:hypothetical protein